MSFLPRNIILRKNINLFSDIIHKKIVNHTSEQAPVIITDSIQKDTDTTLLTNDTIRQKPIQPAISYKAGELNLTAFFESLKEGHHKQGKVRVAWFGDSMIEGDLITQDFRKLLQQLFGGNGVGFVPITSPVAQFRQTIKHTFSDDWNVFSFMRKPQNGYKLGIGGYTFQSSEGSWVEYQATRSYPVFSDVRLICRQCEPQEIALSSDSLLNIVPEDSIHEITELQLLKNKPAKRLKLAFKKANSEVHGLYFDNGNGIYVDNFSFRGNSGIPLSSIPLPELRKIAQKENYKLVILSYGLNVVAHDVKNYNWYLTAFQKTIDYIKTAFPEASILIMSVGDKSYRGDDGYETEPDIPLFVDMQRKLAERSNVAFYNLYEAMGGYNSMVKWAEGNPKYANLDYTHPNFAGGKKIAKMLFDDVIKSYDTYNNLTNKASAPADSMVNKN
jgi:lysophospholipase L1-like esterase